MRDYAKIAPTFWTGATGHAIVQAGAETTMLALYLLTCTHAEAIGVYRLPVAYVVDDTKLDRSVVNGALDRLEAIGFIMRDQDRSLVWVKEMGAWQIGESLSIRDKRRKMVIKRLSTHKGSSIFARIVERYGEAWQLPQEMLDIAHNAPSKPLRSPSEGASNLVGMPLRSQEKEQEQEQTKLDNLQEPTRGSAGVGAARPTPAPSAGGLVVGEQPSKPTDAPEPEPAPEPPPEPSTSTPSTPGAFSRLLERHERVRASKRPDEGRSVRFIADPRAPSGKRAATIFGGDRSRDRAPGPWSIPPEIFSAVEDRLFTKIDAFILPSPPLVPPLPDGIAPENEPDDDLAEAVLVAWRAVYRRHVGKAYTGTVRRIRAAVAKAARMLRAEGISAWTWLAWAWDQEHERTQRRPTLNVVASPRYVGRSLYRFRRDAPQYEGIVAQIEAYDEIIQARQAATMDLRRARPTTTTEAMEIVDRTLSVERYTDLRSRFDLEAATLRSKVEIALKRGHWIWTT